MRSGRIDQVIHTILLRSEFSAKEATEREMDSGARWDILRNLMVTWLHAALSGEMVCSSTAIIP